MIISVHVPKTAGTRFSQYLLKAFPNGVLFDYGGQTREVEKLVDACFEKSTSSSLAGDVEVAIRPEGILRYKSFVSHRKIQVIHGHLDINKYLRIFPDATYIVWLREPLTRALSHYHHYKRALHTESDEINRLVYEGPLSFEQFMLLEQQINLQYRFTNGNLSRFGFVGIVEEFDRCLSVFRKFAGLDQDCIENDIPPESFNQEPIKESYDPDHVIRSRFAELNRPDSDLYRNAIERITMMETSSFFEVERSCQASRLIWQLRSSQYLLADAREQLKVFSSQLSRQTDRVSEKCAHIFDLEAQLSTQAEQIDKLRRPSSWQRLKGFFNNVVGNHSTQETLVSGPAGAGEDSTDSEGSPRLMASPNRIAVGASLEVTEITWDSGDSSEVEIYVAVDGEPEALFASGPVGSKRAAWIKADSSYEFRLYAGTEHQRLLKTVSVTGVKIPVRESRDVFRSFLDPPLLDFRDTAALEVSGWAYSKEAPITWVEALLDNVPIGMMAIGEPRAIGEPPSHEPFDSPPWGSTDYGFSGRFLLDEFLVLPTALVVRVSDEAGNTQDFETVLRWPDGNHDADPRLRRLEQVTELLN